jgi:hypothetical protein
MLYVIDVNSKQAHLHEINSRCYDRECWLAAQVEYGIVSIIEVSAVSSDSYLIQRESEGAFRYETHEIACCMYMQV